MSMGFTPLLYIGPGLGLGTIAIILIVVAIMIASVGLILWIPIKNAFKKISKFFSK